MDMHTQKELPPRVRQLLAEQEAPERLRRHLVLVYNMALALTGKLTEAFPGLPVSENEAHFGAATHDIGKAIVKEELYAEGRRHEQTGYELLLQNGIPGSMARFAKTHGDWQAEDRSLEDLLVTLADKLWKGKRIQELEERICAEIASRIHTDYWDVFMKLDTLCAELALGADARIAWQNQ